MRRAKRAAAARLRQPLDRLGDWPRPAERVDYASALRELDASRRVQQARRARQRPVQARKPRMKIERAGSTQSASSPAKRRRGGISLAQQRGATQALRGAR